MMKLNLLMIPLLAILLLSLSGCTKIEYLPCPNYEPKTLPPTLDLNGTMKRVTADKWLVDHNIVLGVKRFEKACYERSADFISTMEAINKYNEEISKE